MARPKKNKEEVVETDDKLLPEANLDSFMSEVENTFGEGIIKTAKTLIDTNKKVISMGPAFDIGLAGGVPEGSCVILSGRPKGGKTVAALTLAAEAQQNHNGNRKVCYLNIENRIKRRDLLGIKGLKTDEKDFFIAESSPGKILSGEDFLNIGTNFLKNVPGGILIVDSLSCLVSNKTATDGIGSQDRGAGNKPIGQFWDMNAPVINANNNIVIGIAQVYANTSGYGATELEKLSNRWRHQADVWLTIKSFKGVEEGGKQIGQEVEWLIKSSAIGKPGGKVTSYIRYGVGVDKTYELLTLGQQCGFITEGTWCNFDFLTEEDLKGTEYEEKGVVKIQGKANAYIELEKNEVWRDKLKSQIYKMVLGI